MKATEQKAAIPYRSLVRPRLTINRRWTIVAIAGSFIFAISLATYVIRSGGFSVDKRISRYPATAGLSRVTMRQIEFGLHPPPPAKGIFAVAMWTPKRTRDLPVAALRKHAIV